MAYSNQKDNIVFPKITKKLSIEFNNPADLYLPGGKADIYAQEFSGIKSHQMRKILDGLKEAILIGENDEKTAIKKVYVLVAMTAYNKGRLGGSMVQLYNFMVNTISEKTVTDMADIKALDEFFTSVVAYHKSYTRN